MTETVEIEVKRGSLTLKPSEDQDARVESDPPVEPRITANTFSISTKHLSGDVHVTVYIPKNCRRLEASLGRGPASAEDISADRAELNLGLGSLDARNLMGQWDINLGKGDGRVSGGDGKFDLNLGMGRLDMNDVSGTADINSGMGPVHAANCRGTFEVNCGKGSVGWTGAQGNLEINAGMGDVLISDSRGDRLAVNAGLGKVSLKNDRWHKAALDVGLGEVSTQGEFDDLTVHVKTRGAITVEIPEHRGARVEASTEHGRIISHMNLIPVGHAGPQRGQRLVGVTGDGAGRIVLETRRGNVTLSQYPSDGKPADVSEPVQDPRTVILEQLRQGEITVEEAESLLNALD